ncbi:MAG: CinA family nicotinamide mononucleotide deamidase-related protein [Bacteroidales bacterium]|nr:CinA family nicotinamide mononucleotide deamidase-related protein [Bacteroidales bacterium]
MNAILINVGNELLNGHTVNTNAAYISEKLSDIGLVISRIICIADNESELLEIISQSQKKANIVVVTGGLGPTSDDITRRTIAQYFNTTLVYNEEIWNDIQQKFLRRNIFAPENNKIQAYFPTNAIIFPNTIGTAAGFAIMENNFCLIALPGVPFELMPMLEHEVLPFLKEHFQPKPSYVKTYLFSNITESELAEKLEQWDNILRNHHIQIAYLPQPGLIKVKLFFTSEEHTLIKQFDSFANNYLTDFLIYDEDLPLPTILQKILTDKKLTICTAESCTGGYLAHQITSISGSSNYFKGSIIAYSNEIKQRILNVPLSVIEEHGAVSKQVVEIMAQQVLTLLKSDISIAISGIAGPTGETKNKPVGTTWIAIATKKIIWSQQFAFGTDRLSNIQRAATTAMAILIQKLKHNLL